MTTIVYKKILNCYRIVKIHTDGSSEIVLQFANAIDAKLFIGKSALEVRCGKAEVKKAALCDGEICPKLYTGATLEEIEGFIFTNGAVLRKSLDESYVRELSEAVEEISEKLAEYESAISEIRCRIDGKLKF